MCSGVEYYPCLNNCLCCTEHNTHLMPSIADLNAVRQHLNGKEILGCFMLHLHDGAVYAGSF